MKQYDYYTLRTPPRRFGNRITYPSVETKVRSVTWHKIINGKRVIHRLCGPADKEYDINGNLTCVRYFKKGKLHRLRKPAVLVYEYEHGKKINVVEEYWLNGYLHRDGDRPAVIRREYSPELNNVLTVKEEYYKHGNLHRVNGPAQIHYDQNGIKHCESYFIENKKHRVDGPAYITRWSDGTLKHVEYYENNRLHRLNGPARTIYIGDDQSIINWYVYGKPVKENEYVAWLKRNFKDPLGRALTAKEKSLIKLTWA